METTSTQEHAMTTLKPAPVSSRQFHFDPKTHEFTGEISSTNGLGRVYDDACDEGLTIVSARTGVEVTFVVDTTMRVDGEIVGWHLVPATPWSGTRLTVTLFND